MPTPMADSEKPKQDKSQKATGPKRSAERVPQKPAPEKQTLRRPSEKGNSNVSPTQVVITESEYRALVAQKAHEIYLQRCAAGEVDDWLQAERIVKEALLAQGQTAGFV
jgi:hypothetical protein